MRKLFKKSDTQEKRSFFLEDELLDYIMLHSSPADQIQKALIAETADLGWVSTCRFQLIKGNFLTMLVRGIRPRFAVEIGTFTGFSAISSIARDCRLAVRFYVAMFSEEWTSIAQTYWERAGLDDRIDLVLAPAMETLK